MARIAKMRDAGEKGHGLRKGLGGTYTYAHSFKELYADGPADDAVRTVPGQVLRIPGVELPLIGSAQKVRYP